MKLIDTRAPLAVLLAIAALLAACEGARAERQVLTTFFQAIRVRDPILLSRVSVVPIDFQPPGPVQDFTVSAVGAEQRADGKVTKPVTVDVQIRASSGEIQRRPFVFTFEARDGGWIITAVK